MQLKDQVIIVTGAGTGIGKALSKGFAAGGATVVLAGRTEANLAGTAAEISKIGGKSLCIRTDVTDEESVKNLISQTIRQCGRIDTLVSNAGVAERQLNPGATGWIGVTATGEPIIAPLKGEPRQDEATGKMVSFRKLKPDIQDGPKPIFYLSKREWDTIIATNLTGNFLLSREILPHMLVRESGNIIIVGSGKSGTPVFGIPTYVTSKHGLLGFVKQLAMELKQSGSGINVNQLVPGGAIADTGPHAHRTQWQWDEQRKRDGVLPPEVVVNLANLLACQEPFGISGKNLEARAFEKQKFESKDAAIQWLSSL